MLKCHAAAWSLRASPLNWTLYALGISEQDVFDTSNIGAIYLLFKLYQEGEEIGWNRILVTIFFVSYSALYLYVPPFLGMNNQYAGKMYELVPIGCYFMALLPDMEEAETEAKAFVFFAWCGLILIASFLVYFKLHVW